MAIILQVENLTKRFGQRILFQDINFSVNEGDKIGLVAKNGTGKTTLLKVLAGQEDYQGGKITYRRDLRVAILDQKPQFKEGETFESFLEGSSMTVDEKALFIKLFTQINEGETFSGDLNQLSGGQKKRVALAAVLAQQSDVLILDEPTNHLDIQTIEWLENYLSKSRLTLLMVTHDRYFLDRVCNQIIELDDETIFSYPGNFSIYLKKRSERIEQLNARISKINNVLRKEQDWMSRQPQARAGKARYRINRFYELKEKSSQRHIDKAVELNAESTYIGNKIFHAHEVSKSFDNKCVLQNFSYDFARYDKIGIVGKNGVGKTTFVKMLQGIIKPDSGFFDVGTTVSFGYYGQERETYDSSKRVIDVVTDIADDIRLKTGQSLSPLQYLQQFLFTPSDQQKRVSTLSGGELARLHLSIVLMRRPNFLILDEPTNDLDIVTLGILEEYLESFEGCAIIISHDRYFLDNIVDHVFVMEGEGVIKDFPGNYTEYREKQKLQAKQNEEVKKESKEPRTNAKPRQERSARLTFNERREFEALTAEIDALSKEKSQLEKFFSEGSVSEEIDKHTARYAEIAEILDEKEMRWLELSEKA